MSATASPPFQKEMSLLDGPLVFEARADLAATGSRLAHPTDYILAEIPDIDRVTNGHETLDASRRTTMASLRS